MATPGGRAETEAPTEPTTIVANGAEGSAPAPPRRRAATTGSPKGPGKKDASPKATKKAGSTKDAGAKRGATKGGTGPQSRQQRRDAETASRKAEARRRRTLIRRVIVLVCVLALVYPTYTYVKALTAPGTDALPIRTVSWMRDHGMNGVVNTIERIWYTNNKPPVGGTPKNGLPTANAPTANAASRRINAVALASSQAPPHLPAPVNLKPLVDSPLPGEGVWQPTGRQVGNLPAVYTAFFRPDPVHTSLVAGAMWLDTSLLRTVYVGGLQEPPGGPTPWGTQIPVDQRAALVAAFNSGFKMNAALGGVFTEGQMVQPLRDGAASFVITRDGKASVGAWGRDFQMNPNIVTVRQNLSLLIDNGGRVAPPPGGTTGAENPGQFAPGLASDSHEKWGATLGNKVEVWRSGVGVDKNGALIYVGGPALTVQSLADLLLRAGSVRAMELDINTDWVTAYTYESANPNDPFAVNGVKLLPDMARSGDRYLQPGERDFFALFSAF